MSQASTSRTKYLCNPDVVMREEEDEGGLLFNPDTNQVKVVNSTGLFIWKQFESAQDLQMVLQSIRQSFDEVPRDMLLKDVQEFIDEMIKTGFIGMVETT